MSVSLPIIQGQRFFGPMSILEHLSTATLLAPSGRCLRWNGFCSPPRLGSALYRISGRFTRVDSILKVELGCSVPGEWNLCVAMARVW